MFICEANEGYPWLGVLDLLDVEGEVSLARRRGKPQP